MSSVIPEGWKEYRIKDSALAGDRYSFTGGPFGSNLKSEDYTKSGIQIIQLQNIGDGIFKNRYQIFTSEEKANELHSCNIYPGDIILSKMGDPVARATIIPDFSSRFLMASDGIRLSVDKEKFDTKFIHDTINAPNFRAQAEINSTGSTRKRIGLTTLRKLVFVAPPLPEQKKIATILTSIDEVIEKTQAQIDKLKDLKTGMMQELLTQGIGHTEFKNSPVGRIPVGWLCSTVAKSCKIKNNLRKPISKVEREHIKGVYPYYGPTKAVDYINEYRVEGEYTLIGEDGDHFIKFVTWAMTQYVTGKFNVNNHAHIIQGTEECRTKWIYYYFMHRDITRSLTRQGASRYKLNKASLEVLEMAVPTVQEQDRIIEILDALLADINTHEIKVEKLKNTKKALMQDLLTGKVRVNVET